MLVPLPTSSKITKLFSVALWTILATSDISTIKVLCPKLSLSLAPIRANTLSTIVILAVSAGINDPIWASIDAHATERQ